MVIFVLICFAIIAGIVSWYWKYLNFRKKLPHYDGPRPLPLIGNGLKFVFWKMEDVLPKLMQIQEKYGRINLMSVGVVIGLFVSDIKFVEWLLQSTIILKKGLNYHFLSSWLGSGLLLAEGPRWKKHRKITTPAFHFTILEKFVDVFNSASSVLVSKLNNHLEVDSLDIYNLISFCTLDIICETAMGTKVNAQLNETSKYVSSVNEMCRITIVRSKNLLKQCPFLYKFTADYRKEKKALKILHEYTDFVIKDRKAKLRKCDVNDYENNDVGIKKRLVFLDVLLQATVDGEPLPDEYIREEVDTFMFEGHDTTASGISFAIYCLANNPSVQAKVVEELKSIFKENLERDPTYKDLQDMKYLELVIKETLRLYPPVPIFARTIKTDIPFYDGILPRGLAIGISPYLMHRNPDVFPNPEKFDPERFTIENSEGREPFAYIPFSAGPRNCIGQKFAMLEMKAVLSKIIRHFEILPSIPVHVPKVTAVIVLKSLNGICVKFKKRHFV